MNLWNHQIKALELVRASNRFALHMDPGTGKTAVAVKWIEGLLQVADHRVLIFTPPVVCAQWLNEFKLFAPGLESKACVAVGSSKKKIQAFQSGKKIIVTNYESVRSKDVVKAIQAFKPTILVCDESHRVKSPSAMQSKEILKISKMCTYRLNMTGTPCLGSELDLFQQFLILDNGATFGSNFYSFRAKYFEDQNASRRGTHTYFPDWQVRKGSREEIARILSKRSFVVRKSECLDLPDMIYKEIEVEMSPEQERVYNEMKKDFLSVLEDARGNEQVAVGRLVITKGLRLQQIVSGFVGVEDADEVTFKDNPRLDALSDLLEDLTKPVIVWACFRNNYAAIASVCDKLHLTYGFLVGGQNPTQRQETIDSFRRGEIQVLISNQGAGGVGVNLVEAASSIYYSRDFSLEKDIQSEARNYRGGSDIHQKVTRYDLVTKVTIDMDVLKALRLKKDVLEYLLQGSHEKK